MKKISIIVPLYNEEHCVEILCATLGRLADEIEKEERYSVELLLIDDGSTDATWSSLLVQAGKDSRLKLTALSRNFGQQRALTCGYELATGDAIISLDADLQDPPQVIPEMLKRWEGGADIVYAVRERREAETFLKEMTATVFYRFYRLISSSRAPADAGDFRLMSRAAVEALNRYKETHRYIRGMVGCLGFKTDIVTFVRQARTAGTTKFSLFKMITFSMDAIISSSTVPLRLIYVCGFVCALPFLVYLIYAFIAHYLFGAVLDRGWLSLILCSIFFGLFNLICMGVVGEYIGRIYEEVRNRPIYLVRERHPKDE